jgi:hypothetical protein
MQQNLQQVELSMKRWHTRLVRASNALRKLEQKRRRLAAKGSTPPVEKLGAVVAAVERTEAIPLPELDAFFVPTRPKTLADRSPRNDKGISGTISKQPPPAEMIEDTSIPAFLDRRDPLIAEQMTKARKAKEADARKAMPLTGKAALAKIKSKK